MDAEFVASVLKGSDVDAFVIDDNVCRLYPQAALLVGGAKVVVDAIDADRARETLASADPAVPMIGQFLPITLSEPAALVTMIKNWFRRK